MAEHCAYGDLHEEIIRVRLVVGLLDDALSEKMQLNAELTLEKAVTMDRQSETVHKQQSIVRGTAQDSSPLEHESLEASQLNSKRANKKRAEKNKSPAAAKGVRKQHSKDDKCSRCGKTPWHNRQQCPAKDSECHKCHKVGHYSAQCYSKNMSEITEDQTEPDENSFLGAIHSNSSKQWLCKISLNQKQVTFKPLDTGAEVTAISEETYSHLQNITLTKPSKVLIGPADSHLSVTGQFTGNLSHKDIQCRQEIFVVKNLKTNLLGLPAITELQLVERLHNVSFSSTPDSVRESFPNLFSGLGTLGDEYEIKVCSNAKPYALHTARQVPIPLRHKVEKELNHMQSMGVISPVDKPSPWCAGMVVVPKPSGDVRICVDLKPLNQNVLREYHPLPNVDETLAQLAGAEKFSKLDANSGFWQIPLAKKSRSFTTFITPFGRSQFNKLPFGISCAPELFQKRMSTMLSGLQGVLCLMDDVLVFGRDQEEHDKRLEAVLRRVQSAGVTLNPSKCEFSKNQIKFLGHIVNQSGVQADPAKTLAVLELPPPSNVKEMRRFVGMVHQLSKFIPNCADVIRPLTELLSSKHTWQWGTPQDEAFSKIKRLLTEPAVLTLYDPSTATKVSADTSSYGLGAVLLQKSNDQWKPVAYASRKLSETEKRYAQIEKEALALTWACEKFSSYIIGKTIDIETDHKPLVPLMSSKDLDTMPPRILRFRLRMMRYSFHICHVPGKLLYVADTLSRAPVSSKSTDNDAENLEGATEAFISAVVSHLPATPTCLEQLRTSQSEDATLQQVFKYCEQGWPTKNSLDADLKPYWSVSDELSVHDQLLLRGSRIVVPSALREDILEKLHAGHQGIVKTQLRAHTSVWWPGNTTTYAVLSKTATPVVRISKQSLNH